MKKGFEKIVAWQYNECTAIGVLYEFDSYISVAVNYRMDSNMREYDLWFSDDIHVDKGTKLRYASDREIQMLINALEAHNVPYKYDKRTRTIRNYSVYPTCWMRIKKWFGGLLKL